MKSMVVVDYGAALQERQAPEPRLTPGHALLQVLTCGVCFSDVKIARGKMPFSDELSLPHVPGHEICARVIASDPAGAIEPGTRVVVYNVWPCRACDRCRAGEEQICRAPKARLGFTHPGGFQERIVAPLECLLVVPAEIDSIHAASLTCALGTAYRAVVARGGVIAGMRVAVIGIGGVGIHALQVARAAGGMAVAIDRSPRALDVARQLGFDARDGEDRETVAALLAQTHGQSYDVVIEAVGRPATTAMAERLVRPGGRIVMVGYDVDGAIDLPSARFVLEEVEVVGSRYGRMEELERAMRLVADGRVQMIVDRELDLEQADEAFAALENGRAVGRQVLRVTPETPA
jgi:alcohol dehydrogenase